MRGEQEPKPEVGMPCTLAVGSDTYACTIIAVLRNARTLCFKQNHAGEARVEQATLRNDGKYRVSGSHHLRLYIGEAVDYRDPSF